LGKQNRFYQQYPAVFLFLSLTIGVFAGWELLGVINSGLLLGFLVAVLAAFILLPVSKIRGNVMLSALVLMTLGTLRINQDLTFIPKQHLIVASLDSIHCVGGVVKQVEARRDGKHKYVLATNTIKYTGGESFNVQGDIVIYQGKMKRTLREGDSLVIKDRLSEFPVVRNPGGFNYRKHQHLHNIWYLYFIRDTALISVQRMTTPGKSFPTFVQSFREKIIKRVNHYFPESSADIIIALLLGIKRDLNKEMLKDFQFTGTIHVLAISGLHVGFIIMIIHIILTLLRFSVNARRIGILVGLFLFVVLVDFKISVVRSALMASLYFIAQITQKEVEPLNILAGSGLLIFFADTRQLLMPGFQFSFCAVGGILYLYPKLLDLVKAIIPINLLSNRISRGICQAFLVSLAATAGTFPLTWFYFGYIPISGLFLNLLIVPAIGMLVCGSIIFLLISIIPGMPLEGMATLLNSGIQLMLFVVGKVAEISDLLVNLPHPSPGYLVLIFSVIVLLGSLNKLRMRITLYVLLAIISILMIGKGLFEKSEKLQIWYLDVGQGDASIIKCPSGDIIVIDAAEKNFYVNYADRVVIPVLHAMGIKRIKYMVGTHPHSDHIGGIAPIVDQFMVDTLVLSRYPIKGRLHSEIFNTVTKNNVPIRYVKRGDLLSAGNDIRIRVLHPFGPYTKLKTHSGNEVNNSSVILQLVYKNTRFLFTGDLEHTAESSLFAYGTFLKSNVLKVGHHGSKTSTSLPFLSHVNPDAAIISVGSYNKFNHPSQETIRRLQAHGVSRLRTDRIGAVLLESKGQGVEHIHWRR